MGADDKPLGCLLRAEILSTKETVISYAGELMSDSVFVVTDWMAPLGTVVTLRVSLPSVFEPIELRARVAEHRPSRGVGTPAGLGFVFEFESAGSREAVRALVAKLGAHAPEALAALPRGYRVLLVEDNDLIRDIFAYGVAKYFRQRDLAVEVDLADDAASARQKLGANKYDLVIVDYYLPAEDGASFIASLRRDPRFATAPVVAISVGGADARAATLSAGADLFLDKPIVMRDLFETLQVLSLRGAFA